MGLNMIVIAIMALFKFSGLTRMWSWRNLVTFNKNYLADVDNGGVGAPNMARQLGHDVKLG